MKIISSVLMLAVLVSCSEGGSGSGMKNVSRDFLQTPIGHVERGMIINETQTGTSLQTNISAENDYTAEVSPLTTTRSKVLVAIKGAKLFFLEREDNRNTVRTENVPTQAEIDQALSAPGYTRVNGRLNYSSPGEAETDEQGNMTLSYTRQVIGSFSLTNYFCDVSFTYNQNNIVMTKNGVSTNIGSSSSLNQTSCDGKLSKDELKALDLRTVEFCDDAADKGCVQDQNMMELISDLQ